MREGIETVSAAPPKPLEALNAGDRAFEETRYDEALKWYDSAAQTTDDPGLVAFNKSAVLAKLGRLAEAERCLRQTLDDAVIPKERQARAFFNLGTLILKQTPGGETARLQAAAEALEAAEAIPVEDAALREDLQHNLLIARKRYAEAKKRNPVPPPKEEGNDNPPPKKDEPPMKKDGGGENPKKGDATPGKGDGNLPKEKAMPTDRKPSPGAGALPVLMDKDEPQRLSPADTRELLKKADDRFRGDRRRVREGAAESDVPRPNNW